MRPGWARSCRPRRCRSTSPRRGPDTSLQLPLRGSNALTLPRPPCLCIRDFLTLALSASHCLWHSLPAEVRTTKHHEALAHYFPTAARRRQRPPPSRQPLHLWQRPQAIGLHAEAASAERGTSGCTRASWPGTSTARGPWAPQEQEPSGQQEASPPRRSSAALVAVRPPRPPAAQQDAPGGTHPAGRPTAMPSGQA